jgi:putative nucleotidyltransferase with HDIG domain
MAGALTALFLPMGTSTLGQYQVGEVLSEGVIAEVDFIILKSEEDLSLERALAEGGIPPTFNYRPAVGDSMVVQLGRFFERLDSAASDAALLGDSEMLRAHLEEVESVTASPQQAILLMDEPTRLRLREVSVSGVQEYAEIGVVDPTDESELNAATIRIQDPGQEDRRSMPSADVLTAGELNARIVADHELPSTSTELSELLRLIVINHTAYSLVFDPDVTGSEREAARQAVSESIGNVVQQEAVVRANEPLTETHLERLRAYERELRTQNRLEEPGIQFGLLLGQFLLNLSLLTVFGALVFFLRPMIYGSLRWLLLQAALVVTYFVVARVIASYDWPPELLPVAFVVLAVAVLWDSRIALVMGLVLAGLTVAQPPFAELDILFPVMIGGAAAAMCVRVVRRRAQALVFVAIIAGAYAATLLAMSLLGEQSPVEFAGAMGWAGGNAAASAILAMGLVPVFEWFTGITTDQTLLEWADPNAPLLRRLSLEAPGTYAHTINVANLAELAGNGIGAHGLLCRVGLYYHDVGKVLKPHYFVENQHEGRNPHDKLKPDASAAILIEHVVEGLRLGKEAKLPKVVQRFISEHHGTQLIAYFYHRAQENLRENNVDEADYRYPGPKPQSKETAIAMMADSIESATRVLQEPTPERVRDLVDGIIESKRQDGQLDEAPLTMREISALKDTFVTVLSGIYHHRIDYPTTKHLTDAPDETSKTVSASERKTIAPAPVSSAGSAASDGEAGADGEAAVSGEAGASGEAEASEQMELGDDERRS